MQLGFHKISKKETQHNRVNNVFELMFMFNVLELVIFNVLEVEEY